MAGQYGLPKRTPLSAGSPTVSPSAAAAHQLLDQPVGALIQKFAPQYIDKIPPDKLNKTFREVMKTSGFMEKAMIMSVVGQHLPKGVTAEDIGKAVNEAPPAVAAPAEAPAAPAAAEAPAAAAIAAAPPPSAAFTAAKGPTVAAAQGGGRAVITPELMRAIMKIESGGNPNARTGSYKGLYQLSDEEFAKRGGKGSIFDPKENERIAALKLQQEADQVAKKLGRDLTPGEIYLVHQQGTGGAAAHLSNPDRPAWQSMHSTGEGRSKGEGWSRLAIWGNVPDKDKAKYGSVDNLTSGEFTKMWGDRIARGMGGSASGGASASTGKLNSGRDGEGGEGSNIAANAGLPPEERGITPVQSPEGTGGIGSDSARAPSQYETDPSATASTLGKGIGEGVGDAFEGLAKIFAGGGARALPSTPANAQMPSMATPQGPVPIVDPRVAEAQRQQLAMAMQRLNSGKLF